MSEVTHWDDCWEAHHACAAALVVELREERDDWRARHGHESEMRSYVIAERDELQAQVDALREELERVRHAAQHTLDMLETLDLAARLPASVRMLRAALSPATEDAPKEAQKYGKCERHKHIGWCKQCAKETP